MSPFSTDVMHAQPTNGPSSSTTIWTMAIRNRTLPPVWRTLFPIWSPSRSMPSTWRPTCCRMQSKAPRAEYCTLKRSHPVSCLPTDGATLNIYLFYLFKAPSQPRNVFAKATKHNELKVKWAPPAEPNGNITHYIVRVTRDQYLVNHRDYCTEGKLSLSTPFFSPI